MSNRTNIVTLSVFIGIIAILAISALTIGIIANHKKNNNANTMKTNLNLDELNIAKLKAKTLQVSSSAEALLYEFADKRGAAGEVLKLSTDSKLTTFQDPSVTGMKSSSNTIENSIAIFENETGETLNLNSDLSISDQGEMTMKKINIVNESNNTVLYSLPTSAGLPNQVIKKSVGNTTVWATAAGTGTGDVSGPTENVENINSLCIFDHESGHRIKASKAFFSDDIFTSPEINTGKLTFGSEEYSMPTQFGNQGDIMVISDDDTNQLAWKQGAKGNIVVLFPPANDSIPVSVANSNELQDTQVYANDTKIRASGIDGLGDGDLLIAVNEKSTKGKLTFGSRDQKNPILFNSNNINYNSKNTNSVGTKDNPIIISNEPIFFSNASEISYIKLPVFDPAVFGSDVSQKIDVCNVSQTHELIIAKENLFIPTEDFSIGPCRSVRLTSVYLDETKNGWIVGSSSNGSLLDDVLSYNQAELIFEVNDSKTISPLVKEYSDAIVNYRAFPEFDSSSSFKIDSENGKISYSFRLVFETETTVQVIASTARGFSYTTSITLTINDVKPNFQYSKTGESVPVTEFNFNVPGFNLLLNAIPVTGNEQPYYPTWSVEYDQNGKIPGMEFSTTDGSFKGTVPSSAPTGIARKPTITVSNKNNVTQTLKLIAFT